MPPETLSFEARWDEIAAAMAVHGAISAAELAAIHWAADQVAPDVEGVVLDLGTHCGKAAVALAAGTAGRRRRIMVLVDSMYPPESDDAAVIGAWRRRSAPWPYAAEPGFVDRVRGVVAPYAAEVLVRPMLSVEAIPTLDSPVAMAFIDTGDHLLREIEDELSLLRQRLCIGSVVGFHDFGNQFAGPREAATALVATGDFAWVEPPWDRVLACVRARDAERSNVSWHKYPGEHPDPMFVGFVRRIR